MRYFKIPWNRKGQKRVEKKKDSSTQVEGGGKEEKHRKHQL